MGLSPHGATEAEKEPCDWTSRRGQGPETRGTGLGNHLRSRDRHKEALATWAVTKVLDLARTGKDGGTGGRDGEWRSSSTTRLPPVSSSSRKCASARRGAAMTDPKTPARHRHRASAACVACRKARIRVRAPCGPPLYVGCCCVTNTDYVQCILDQDTKTCSYCQNNGNECVFDEKDGRKT